MTTKAEFTPEEWTTLRDAPHVVAGAVSVAGASGLLGTLKEVFSTVSGLVAGMRSENELIRSLCAREEIQGAQESLRSLVKQAPGADLETVKTRLQSLATEKVVAALGVLKRKAGPEDVAAYRAFVRGLGERVSEAAVEGSFLGFGGERVSEGERKMLAALDGVLATG
jgi:hypothetical protein